ncbi:MAG: 23S rRNA (uracil(1939)-C(5))-methyltransferase RlmD, partial [Lachnospiraceae bacterium]|nr:23S rRNA (uracil(1939)-C(5))-methyltransferase RlmD [Lachnospiraceae bacterium]
MNEINTCPYSKKCGGCMYSGVSYGEQLDIKNGLVRKYLGPVAKENGIKPEPVAGAADPFYYRNKVHSVFARTKKGQIVRGIYRRDSHEVIPVSGCLLENKKADAIIEEIKKLVPSFKYRIFDEDNGTGWLRHVLVRTGTCGGKEEIMVILVTSEVPFPGKNNFVKALRSVFPEITTIVQNINAKRTSMVLGERNIVVYGKGFIEDDSLGLRFRISPGSFFQINGPQTKKLYGLALEFAQLTGSETVLDAYCGTGTIGMFMSAGAKRVVGVELNPDAVRDARDNAKRNGIANIEFICADATKYMLGDMPTGIDVLCMDPPRSGSTPEFIKTAAGLGIGRIVYVSCNPETLARDLKLFMKHGYRVKRLSPVDMFPLTDNLECC